MGIEEMHPHSGRYLDEDDVKHNVIEQITGGFKEINTDHGAIHLGYGMVGVISMPSLTAGAVKAYRIVGPSTLFAHIKNIQISTQGAPLDVQWIKGATLTTPGTLITNAIQNANHNSTTAPQTKIYEGSVGYTGGTIWDRVIVQGDTSGVGVRTSVQAANFVGNSNQELVTKDGSEEYFLRIENLDGSATALNTLIKFFFYEEPKGLV